MSQVRCLARAKVQDAAEGLLRLVWLFNMLLFYVSITDTAGGNPKCTENSHETLKARVKGMVGPTLYLLKPVTEKKRLEQNWSYLAGQQLVVLGWCHSQGFGCGTLSVPSQQRRSTAS